MEISRAVLGFVAARPEDAPLAMQIPADSRAERQGEVLEDALIVPDGAGRAQPAIILRERAVAEHAGRLAQENDGAIDPDDFAEQEEKLLEQRGGVQAVGEHAGKAAQALERAQRIDIRAQRDGLDGGGLAGTSALFAS